jgi:predicted membrane channel-forming protein YqfA (hemolysin III family)
MRVLLNRLGIFFLLVSASILVLFFTSDVVQEPNISYLFWGIVFLILGVLALRRSRPEPEESKRFRTYRKLTSRKKKKEDK